MSPSLVRFLQLVTGGEVAAMDGGIASVQNLGLCVHCTSLYKGRMRFVC